jgi:hypothetical protein
LASQSTPGYAAFILHHQDSAIVRQFIMVGTFDDPNWVTPERQIWTSSARHWLPLPDELESHEDGSMPPLKTS